MADPNLSASTLRPGAVSAESEDVRMAQAITAYMDHIQRNPKDAPWQMPPEQIERMLRTPHSEWESPWPRGRAEAMRRSENVEDTRKPHGPKSWGQWLADTSGLTGVDESVRTAVQTLGAAMRSRTPEDYEYPPLAIEAGVQDIDRPGRYRPQHFAYYDPAPLPPEKDSWLNAFRWLAGMEPSEFDPTPPPGIQWPTEPQELPRSERYKIPNVPAGPAPPAYYNETRGEMVWPDTPSQTRWYQTALDREFPTRLRSLPVGVPTSAPRPPPDPYYP